MGIPATLDAEVIMPNRVPVPVQDALRRMEAKISFLEQRIASLEEERTVEMKTMEKRGPGRPKKYE